MGIESTLLREGITNIEKLNTREINRIAKNISKTLSETFSDHNLSQSDLFIAICRLNMYRADFTDNAKAKYFYKNSSIYFDRTVDFNHMDTVALHECLHYIQEYRDTNGKVVKMGLYDLKRHSGIALNEAAVQHMASIANNAKVDSVKYYNLELTTESPDFYPIQTALLNQMMYFTGSYALYHSTLFSTDVFKNTFAAQTDIKTYSKIEKNIDNILEYENNLSIETLKLANVKDDLSNINKIRKINSVIDDLKSIIVEKTIETQNMIFENGFRSEFDSIKTLKDVKAMKLHLYNFKPLLIHHDQYERFDEFYSEISNELEEKKLYIKEYGEISFLDEENSLSVLEEKSKVLTLFKSLIHKIKLLSEEKIREKDF